MNMHSLDRRVGLALAVAAAGSMCLLAAGVAIMVAGGVQPLTEPAPKLEPGKLGSDLAALRAEGWLWLGLIAVILTPAVRVAASLVLFAAARDWRQTAIALAVLAVIALSVVVGYGG
jgi:uncharacterized membrane protein